MSRIRLVALMVAGLVAALTIGACGDDDDDEGDGGEAAGGGKIGFLLPETQTTRYEAQDRPLFEGKVDELCPDCEILYSNADQDIPTQQQQVEAAITEEVDVLVLDPVDSASAAGLANRAKQAGIPVISYDRLILDADLDYYVSFDSVVVGEQQAEALSEKLADEDSPEGPIVMINGDPQDNNATLFNEGATSVFDSEGVEIAREFDTPDWLPENAQREMDQAITALGEDGFEAVYAANDGTAGGAIAALKAAGIDPAQKPVTGQDAELAAIQRVLDGEQFVTVYKPIKPLAESAAELAVAIANGEEPPEGLINGEEDNGTEQVPTVFLDTVPVTRENVEDTIIADDFWSVDEICTQQFQQACRDAGIQ
ncbi:MAG: sugar ABC transporter substrate-binding protein [Solirubrobacterales bacterium]